MPENPKFTIAPSCDMLIDQDRHIGSDPVGHVCYNRATRILGNQYYICDSCVELLSEGSDRITIPERGSVQGWKERAEECLNSILNGMRDAEARPTHVPWAPIGNKEKV